MFIAHDLEVNKSLFEVIFLGNILGTLSRAFRFVLDLFVDHIDISYLSNYNVVSYS